MSDLFNTSKGKNAFLSVLRDVEQGGTIEDGLPRFWKPSDSTKLSNKPRMRDLAKVLIDLKVPVFKTRAIPSLIQIDSTSVINPDLAKIMIPGARLHDKVQFPGGETEFIPTYLNSDWYVEDYDLPIMKQIMYRLILMGGETLEHRTYDIESAKSFIGLLWEAVETKAYGNGSLIGQCERLGTMWKVKRGEDGYFPSKSMVKGYELEDSPLPLETLSLYLEKYLPIGPVSALTYEGGWVGLIHRPSKYLQPYDAEHPDAGEYDWLPNIRPQSSSGLPYLGKTKRDTVTEALAIADQFILKISSSVKQAIDSAPRKSNNVGKNWNTLKQTLEDYWYLSCGLEFPKGERYEKSKWHTKTRNIWSSSFPTHLIMSLISHPVMMSSPNATTFDTPSLYGFSPFHGGMNTMIAKIIKAEASTSFVYADNYYLLHVDKVTKMKTWFSLDLVRGESQTTKEDCQLLAYYLLSRGHITEEGKPAFNATWAYLSLFIIPNLCVDSSGLMGNIQFQIPGQGSGNSWTFLLNHIKVSLFDHKWGPIMRGTNDKPGSDLFKEICKKLGVNFTIERVIEDFEAVLVDARATTEEEWTHSYLDGIDQPPLIPPVQVEIDLLGWSAIWSPPTQEWIGVLEAKRLAESIALPKGMANRQSPTIDYISSQCYKMARMEAARLVGAWQYWPVDTALKERSKEIRQTLYKKGVGSAAIDRALKRAIENIEMADIFQKESMSLQRETMPADFIKLNSGSPSMSEQQLYGMEARGRYTYNTPKPTVSEIAVNPAKAMIGRPYMEKLLNILGDGKYADLGKSGVDKFRDLAKSARSDINKIHDMFLGAGKQAGNVDIMPNTRPKTTTDPEEAANPVVFYRVPDKLPLGVIHRQTGHGPESEPVNMSRTARRKRSKK